MGVAWVGEWAWLTTTGAYSLTLLKTSSLRLCGWAMPLLKTLRKGQFGAFLPPSGRSLVHSSTIPFFLCACVSLSFPCVRASVVLEEDPPQ